MSILDGVKAYLRVDGNQEDEVIRTLIDTAKTFILQGTGVEVISIHAPRVRCDSVSSPYTAAALSFQSTHLV